MMDVKVLCSALALACQFLWFYESAVADHYFLHREQTFKKNLEIVEFSAAKKQCLLD